MKKTDTKDNKSSEFEQKQKELDLQHKATVNKIKSEIWGDRLNFLQKMIKLSDENKDMQSQETAPLPSQKPVVPQAQALAQQSTKGKTQADAKIDSKTKGKGKDKTKQKTKNKKEKQDLLHRIDSQLAKLKGKNKSKSSEGEEQQDYDDTETPEEANPAEVPATTDAVTDNGIGSKYFDTEADEYAVNHPEINYRLDNGYGKRRGDLDLYDIFRDFDRDGDGIVDDIDLDDPHWKESCNKNGYDPLD